MQRKFKYKNSYSLNRDLGIALKRVRNKKGIKQVELADTVGVNRSYISELEAGKRNPTVETLVLICTALEVPISKVFIDAESIQ